MLGEMISETTLDVKMNQLGLNIDNETLIAHIHANPAFRGPTGSFDPNRFYDLLRSAGLSEERYVDSERRLILRQQFARAVGGDAAAPEVMRDAVRRFETEQRTIEYVELDRASAGPVPDPTPAEIEAYFAEHKASFRAPEYRKLAIIALTPETLAGAIKISDEEVRKAYEERRDRFATPERREVEQIVFPNSAEAEAAAQRLAGGAKFEEIAADRGLKQGDIALGMVARSEILDPAVAEAVFALKAGDVSKPVTGRFGTVIARVNKIEAGKEPAYADVADSLRKELAVTRARNELLDQHDRIEDERAAGARLAEVANKLGLKLVTVDAVDRSGRAPDGKTVENVPALTELLPGAFATDVGVETDPVEFDNGNGYVWYEVAEITPSRERSLEEVRDRVVARWKDEQLAKRLAERAESIRSRLDAGEGFDKAAAGLKVEKREGIRRGRAVEGLDRGTLAAVFDTAKGKAGIGLADDRVGRTVFRVTEVTVPEGTATSERAAELATNVQEDILVQYVLQLQEQYGVTVNEAALRTITGSETGN
jgi:peptidyl-prolyl cis-trans isomerase D